MSANQNQANSKLVSESIRAVLETGSTAALATLLDLPETNVSKLRIGAKLIVKHSTEKVGGLGDDELDRVVAAQANSFLKTRDDAKALRVGEFGPELQSFQNALILFERIEGEPHLVIAGAGHVGASLARLAALLGYRLTIIDDRGEFVTRELFQSNIEQGIDLVVAENWSDAVRAAIANGRGVSVAIVTRGHKQDEDCLRAPIVARPASIAIICSKRPTTTSLANPPY